jgi:WD40-like Beta Propeller Repeat
MRDDVTFEARLADALGRYAELAPTMDDAEVARQAIAAGRPARRIGWPAFLQRGRVDGPTTGRPAARVAYLLIVLALILAAILLAVAAGAFRNDSILPVAGNGTIAFTVQGNDHGPAGTRLMNPDGTGDHAIDLGRCPSYSRDGSALATLSYEESAYLVVAGVDGKPARKVLLLEAPSTSIAYAISPDGTEVAWFKPSPAGASASPAVEDGSAALGDGLELWVTPIAGGRGTRILAGSGVANELHDSPLWSPDGSHLAFGTFVADETTGVRHRTAISVVAADGSDPHPLTGRPGVLGDGMSWSPDGRFLAYLGLPDAPQVPTATSDNAPPADPPRDLFVVAVDGTGDRNLTNSPAFESQPDWSPDGKALAFETSPDGEAHRVAQIRMNGPTPLGPLVLGPESAWFVWSPDAARLLWVEVTTIGSETYRSTLQSIDRDFRESSIALQTVDGLIVCAPSWQRLEP